jgi:ATP-dependent helicase/nuclease subunit B
VRLDAFLRSQLGEAEHLAPATDWLALARALDAPRAVAPEGAPTPRPPLALRPRRLSVTEVERLLRDPFEIYARMILGLRKLPAIDEPVGRGDWGSLVHAAIAVALRRAEERGWPGAATFREWIITDGVRRFEVLDSPANAAFWRPRLSRIAAWMADAEEQRRAAGGAVACFAEIKGELTLPGGFVLHGRADRIDLLASGGAELIDYKTGTIPSQREIDEGYALQLPLEAAMLARGAFPALGPVPPAQLAHWKLTGGFEPAKIVPVTGDVTGLAEAAFARFEELRAYFADAATPYRPVPHPHRAPKFSDYLHLARVAEWGGE